MVALYAAAKENSSTESKHIKFCLYSLQNDNTIHVGKLISLDVSNFRLGDAINDVHPNLGLEFLYREKKTNLV